MADKENQFQGVVESLLKGMDTVLSTKTVVGEATKIGDTIILPLVDVTFGVGAGAGNNSEKKSASGAGGLGGKMTPSAVLVIKNGSTKLVNIKNQDTVPSGSQALSGDPFDQLQRILVAGSHTENEKFFVLIMRLYQLSGIKNIQPIRGISGRSDQIYIG